MDTGINENLMVKLLERMPNEHTSVHKLCYMTGMDHRTIKKYVQLIILVQDSPRLRLEIVGFRVLVRKER